MSQHPNNRNQGWTPSTKYPGYEERINGEGILETRRLGTEQTYDMVERVANALYDADTDDLSNALRYKELAKAAIAAMRDDAMDKAANPKLID